MYRSPSSALQNVFILVIWANLREFIIYQQLLLRHTSLQEGCNHTIAAYHCETYLYPLAAHAAAEVTLNLKAWLLACVLQLLCGMCGKTDYS